MDETFFNDYEELFATKGWRRLLREAEDAIREREFGALHAPDFNAVMFLRGEVAQLSALLTLEQQIALLYEQSEERD